MPTTQTFTTTGSWVCPTGVSSVVAECWGGGGAGGVASGTASGAGGGAGGQYAIKVVSVSAGTTYTVTVATAAVAVTTGGVVTNGSDSWFNTTGTVIAKGGAGGADATGATGAGGTGSTTGGIGDTVFAGGSGAAGVSSTQSGGGGGGAGSTGTGNSGSGATAGAAKANNGGAGGNGVSTANTQNSGQNFGGGGSGGLSSSATNRKGGDGAPGLVILTWDIDPSIIFFPFTNQPTRKLESKRSLNAGSVPHLAFVPQLSVPTADTHISGQSVDPSIALSFQYQSDEQPLTPLAAIPFVQTQDALMQRRTRRGAHLHAATAFVSQVAEPSVPATFISGQSVDPASLITFQYPSMSWPIPQGGGGPPETLSLDKWMAQSRDPVRRARRLAIYGVNTAIAKETPPVVPMEWAAQFPLPRKHRYGLKDYSFLGLATGAGPEPSTPAVFISGQSVDPMVVRSFQYDDFARTYPALAAETITLDKWASHSPVVRMFQKRITEGLYVVSPRPIPEILSVDKWLGQSPVVLRVKRARLPDATVRPFVTSTLPPLTWYQPSVIPRRVLRALQYLYPSFSFTRIIIPPVYTGDPAVWQNLGTVTINAASLATITLLIENLGDPGNVVFEDTDLVLALTENVDAAAINYEDTDISTVKYEDTDIV